MAVTLEIKYFNSFLIKKTVKSVSTEASWCGDPSNPDYYPLFPIEIDNSSDASIQKGWYVEESRIFGGFNENEVDLGVRAYSTNKNEPSFTRENSLIYSGIFNSRTSVNDTNVFSVAEDITKSLDSRYGGIDRLHSEDSNMIVFQELKVSSILIDRDAIFTAEGSSDITSSNKVLGAVNQYSGDNGTGGFPESFAFNGIRKYFADPSNGEVLRLSRDGMTEISNYGMEDFFRDEFKKLNPENKRIVVDATWTIPWGVTTDTIVISGDNLDEIDIGMSVEGVDGESGLYVADIATSGSDLSVTLNKTLSSLSSPQPSALQFVKIVRDKVIGGYDKAYENYVVSIVYNPPSKSTESGLSFTDQELDANPDLEI